MTQSGKKEIEDGSQCQSNLPIKGNVHEDKLLTFGIKHTVTGKSLANFFSFFLRIPPPWGKGAKFGTGRFCEMEDSMCKTFARHCKY